MFAAFALLLGALTKSFTFHSLMADALMSEPK